LWSASKYGMDARKLVGIVSLAVVLYIACMMCKDRHGCLVRNGLCTMYRKTMMEKWSVEFAPTMAEIVIRKTTIIRPGPKWRTRDCWTVSLEYQSKWMILAACSSRMRAVQYLSGMPKFSRVIPVVNDDRYTMRGLGLFSMSRMDKGAYESMVSPPSSGSS
jgi:hypothetical protein